MLSLVLVEWIQILALYFLSDYYHCYSNFTDVAWWRFSTMDTSLPPGSSATTDGRVVTFILILHGAGLDLLTTYTHSS
jgi:hypothetical protein